MNLKDFESTFEKLSDSLNELMIPFGLFSINESTYICEGEEREDFEKSFDNFRISYKQALMFCKTLITCSKPVTNATNKETFIYTLDANIKVTVENFENMVSTKDAKKFKDIERVKNAYFAYLQLARAINTSIAQYNKRFPDYILETLENVPEASFLNSVDSLQNFSA